jgi:hypothetical protein
MRCSMVLIALLALASSSAALDTGVYVVSELTVRGVPSTNSSGIDWDAWSQPDLYVQFFITNFGNNYLQQTWGTKQDCGSSATWSSTYAVMLTNDLTDGAQAYLTFSVWDDDTYTDEFVCTGAVRIQSLLIGVNEISCGNGARISFVLDGPYEQ